MRVYIATSLENAGGHNSIWGAIKAAVPHAELTYDWTEHGSVQGDGEARIRAVAIAEAEGVMSADLVVALLPGRARRGAACRRDLDGAARIASVGHLVGVACRGRQRP